jgi:hypothetical protein
MTHLQARRARPVPPGAPLGALTSAFAVLAVVTLVTFVLAGCGDAVAPGQSVPPRLPTQRPATTSGGPARSPAAGEVTPVAGQRERRVPWRLVDTGPGPSVVVEVQAGGPPCDVVTHLDVDETPSAVRLDVWAGREPGAVCVGVPALLGTFRIRVPLTEPLGSRPITPRAG